MSALRKRAREANGRPDCTAARPRSYATLPPGADDAQCEELLALKLSEIW